MASYRIWALRFVVALVTIEMVIAFLNFHLDPLWCFGNVNRCNATSIVIDQRLQKTGLLAFGPAGYDTLILGSSRSEPLNGRDFPGEKVFNYALPALYPDEYAAYITYFKRRNGRTFRRLYLGLDFFGTAATKPLANKPPNDYFVQEDAEDYRLNSLMSADPLWKYLKGYFNKEYYYRYDRKDNILIPRQMSAEERRRFTEKRLAVFRDKFYASGVYAYNPKFGKLLADIAAENGGVQVCAFTSPVSCRLFEQMVRQGRYDDYERWLREIVWAFGSVYNFMTVNTVTSDMGNFYDADHLYPAAAAHIAYRLCGGRGPAVPADFGDYVTARNIEPYLKLLRRRVEALYGPLPAKAKDEGRN